MNKQQHQSLGFTLLELVIVMTILGILLPATFAMFMANLRAQTKVLVLEDVKRNGDAALDVIESKINVQAQGLEQLDGTGICVATDSQFEGDIYFVQEDGSRFMFRENNGRIELVDAATDILTADSVVVSGFAISCNRESQFTPPLISIAFTVEQARNSIRAEETAELRYQTKIRLRNL